jgi:hypothetical protein
MKQSDSAFLDPGVSARPVDLMRQSSLVIEAKLSKSTSAFQPAGNSVHRSVRLRWLAKGTQNFLGRQPIIFVPAGTAKLDGPVFPVDREQSTLNRIAAFKHLGYSLCHRMSP